MDQVAVREVLVPPKTQDPREAVAEAKKQADALMDIVKATGICKKIGDKEHLQVEAWQTIARFNRCLIDTGWTRDIKDSAGEVSGVEAQARLRRLDDGVEIGTAEAACMMDEDGNRFADYHACKSMAQTRAQGKMGRMAFAWVAVLAGYAGTPAEEMGGFRILDSATALPNCPKCGAKLFADKKTGGFFCWAKKGGCGATYAKGHFGPKPEAPKDEHGFPGKTIPYDPLTVTEVERARIRVLELLESKGRAKSWITLQAKRLWDAKEADLTLLQWQTLEMNLRGEE